MKARWARLLLTLSKWLLATVAGAVIAYWVGHLIGPRPHIAYWTETNEFNDSAPRFTIKLENKGQVSAHEVEIELQSAVDRSSTIFDPPIGQLLREDFARIPEIIPGRIVAIKIWKVAGSDTAFIVSDPVVNSAEGLGTARAWYPKHDVRWAFLNFLRAFFVVAIIALLFIYRRNSSDYSKRGLVSTTVRVETVGELRVAADRETLNRLAAEEFLRLGSEAIRARGRFAAGLSGGSTPRGAFERIAASWRKAPGGPLDWNRTHLFWGDERHVPLDDPQSNYRMAREALIDLVPIPPGNVHPVPAAQPDPEAAAATFEAEIRQFFELRAGQWPRFDLIFLGMGPDGHVGSLFPGSKALEETHRVVAANWVEKLGVWRITFTFPVLNQTAHTWVLVAGRDKTEALRRVIEGPHTPPLLPAERLQPKSGSLVWLADREAAAWRTLAGI